VTDALRFDGVTKAYARKGPKALDAFSCRFPRGALCGLVGPNGAGKTTAFSLVSGYLGPDEGQVVILGQPGFDPWRLKGRLGVLPQDADLGDQHTPRELLAHLGRLQGLGGGEAAREAERVLDLVRLTERRDRRIGTLSHGMRRRVAVASALVGDPDLVLLDEPTAGLDPVQAISLREALSSRRADQTVIVSSHNLDELERICDWVVMMDRGKVLRQGTIAEVTGRGQVVHWTIAGEAPLDVLRAALPGHAFSVDGAVLVQRAPSDVDLDASSVVIAGQLAAAGVAIREVKRGMSLEQRFLDDAARLAR
jgi:ABC-2 type transport system ATP-binding protein